MKNIYATVELHIQRADYDLQDLPDLLAKWGCFGQTQECVWVVAYDASTMLRSVIEVARGNEFEVTVDVAAVFNAVEAAAATRFRIIHNHPSGVVTPTKSDINLTKQIGIAAAMTGRYLEDHIIIGPPRQAHSMADHGEFKVSPAIQRLYAANSPVWTHREPR